MPELGARFLLPVLAAMTAATSCGRSLTNEECFSLLDRYTSLLVQEENPELVPAEVDRAKTDARALARNDPRFGFSSCSKKVSRTSFDCAMKAPTVDEMERCLVF